MVTGQDAATSHVTDIWPSPRKVGWKSERETARPLASLRRCEAPHMGLAAADTKGQAAEGAMWVKMNVKEKSTGEFRMRGARGGGGEGARERDEAVQNQVPNMGLALPKTRPTK